MLRGSGPSPPTTGHRAPRGYGSILSKNNGGFVAVDLGTLGGTRTVAVAVNASDQVVGSSELSGGTASDAFSWTATSGIIDLGTLGGTRSSPTAVSPSGQVIGLSTLAGDTATH